MRVERWRRIGVAATLLGPVGCYDGMGGSADDASAESGGSGDVAEGGAESGDDPPGEPLQCDGQPFDPGPNLVRRLTVREYGNTVHAVLGVDVRAEAVAMLPAEVRADGFTNTTSGLITTLTHIESYEALAQIAVARIPDMGALVDAHTGCTEPSDACKREFIERLGLVVFRRPPTADEVTWLVPVFAAAEAEGEGFEVGAGLVLEAMLQSPPFLYRLEDETSGAFARPLDNYELASRLSYLLWAGPPDATLLDSAASDALQTDAAVEAEVDRMLADPRARDASLAFADDWLNLGRLDHLTRSPAHFPSWSTEIGRAMGEETTAYFGSVVWDQQRALADLHDAQETWLTPELAEYYGLEPAGPGLLRYDVTDIPERGGLLTQGSLLTVGGDTSSMVSRGLFVLRTLMCGDLSSPPEGVDTEPPAVEPGRSQRDYAEERLANPSCLGCHQQMEPLAFGLERFVADGTYRTENFFGNPLREDGYVREYGTSDDHEFSNVAELMAILGASDRVDVCFTLKGMQFAAGRGMLPSDQCGVDGAHERFSASPGTWRDLMVSVALSPGFRSIRVE